MMPVHVRCRRAPVWGVPRRGVRRADILSRRLATALAVAALAGACGGTEPAAGSLAVGVPEAVLSARDVDRTALGLEATINGEPVEAERTESGWILRAEVPEGEAVDVEVRWFETVGDARITLAAWSTRLEPLRASRTIEVRADELDTASFDDDGDRVSNLDERRGGSDPFVADAPGTGSPEDESAGGPAPPAAPSDDAPDVAPIEPLVSGPAPGEDPGLDVLVPFVDPGIAGSIVVDGGFEEPWRQAVFVRDESGRLWLNPLQLIDDDDAADPTLQDGVPDYIWFALHDGVHLYLFVQGEAAENGSQTPQRDSVPGPFFNDDAVSVLIDANGSREASLQSDDVYFAYPLVELEGEERRPLYSLSTALPAPPGLEYSACECIGSRSGWEMKIPLAEVGLVPGQEFGLELQIHEDVDGGGRDALYGWAGPPIERRDAGAPFESPASFGTVVLALP